MKINTALLIHFFFQNTFNDWGKLKKRKIHIYVNFLMMFSKLIFYLDLWLYEGETEILQFEFNNDE